MTNKEIFCVVLISFDQDVKQEQENFSPAVHAQPAHLQKDGYRLMPAFAAETLSQACR
jgi:hypothetical protein